MTIPELTIQEALGVCGIDKLEQKLQEHLQAVSEISCESSAIALLVGRISRDSPEVVAHVLAPHAEHMFGSLVRRAIQQRRERRKRAALATLAEYEETSK